jgi:tyrosyl-tRNA synthetase
VGHLLNIMMLRWLQKTGHKPITLMGGRHDQGGRSVLPGRGTPAADARADRRQHRGHAEGLRRYLSYGDGPSDAIMLNNAEWLDSLNYLDFLRDIGRHFSVNRMLSFES